MNKQPISVDIVIFGGGIAGLWVLNRLRSLGFQAVLFETDTLGGGQTTKSQGIIHGGIKYALTGHLNGSANTLEAMPKRWEACLQGRGEIDLQTVKILSPYQLLWSTGSLSSNVTGFFASLALNSRVKKLDRIDYPTLLQHSAFKGQVYKLEEMVLDPYSLVEALAKPHQASMIKINPNEGYQFGFEPSASKQIQSVQIYAGNETLHFQAKQYIFAAGEGNEQLASHLIDPPAMQRRPLQMVLAKLEHAYPFYGHCMDQGTDPRITITSFPTQDNKTGWYLGGKLAELGATRTASEQILAAKKELSVLFPWVDLKNMILSSFFVNRAEAKQPGGKRPDADFLQSVGNALIVWPTKLALAPLLADKIISQLEEQGITPSQDGHRVVFSHLATPSLALRGRALEGV